MSLKSVLLATATLCAYVADAHMIMSLPVPFSVGKVDSAPITKDQWPCKFNLGYTVTEMNSMKVGEEQIVKFNGTAVHGGGSCQLSVTTDTEPTKSSKFKVIESIEGGCPGIQGAEEFKFTLPDSIPNGKATFAWTWFAKLSGGPEMYMNCAPIDVTGGASDSSKFDALPDMFVANLPDVKECKTVTSKATKFPNPGQVVISGNDGSDVEPPTGSDCGASSGTSPEPSGGAGAPVSSAAGGQASAAPSSAGGNDGMYTPPAGAGATSAAATSAAATSAAASSAAATSVAVAPTGAASAPAVSKPAATSAAATGGTGGVFAPGASSAAAGASTKTTLVTVTGTPSAPSVSKPAVTTPAATGTGASGAAPTSAPATGGSSTGTCSTNGAILCNGTTQFGICDNGSIVWQAVAAGTTCNNGTISKRAYNGRVVRRHRRSLVGHIHKH